MDIGQYSGLYVDGSKRIYTVDVLKELFEGPIQ